MPFCRRPTRAANSPYQRAECSAGPEMISGVRASSIRIESTSSTIAKLCPRCTSSSADQAMLSRRKSKPNSLLVPYVMSHSYAARCSAAGRLGRMTPTVSPRNSCTRPIHSASRWAR